MSELRLSKGNTRTVVVTMELRRHLTAEIVRTNVTARILFKTLIALPEGLTLREVNRWIGGLSQGADNNHLAFILAAWASIPDATPGGTGGSRRLRHGSRTPETGWVHITPAMVQHLKSEFDRTGQGVTQLLTSSHDLPKGLTPQILRSWLNGETKSALETEWCLLTAALAALPTAEKKRRARKPREMP